MRLQLAAALTRLDEAGAIHVRRDTTRRAGRPLAAARTHFDAAAVRFAGVVYGRRPPTVDDARRSARAPRRDRRRGRAPMSDSRRLIVIGIAVLAVLGALRVLAELTRDDQRAQGPAGSSYAYGPYGATAYASLLRALGPRGASACATGRATSTSTRG